MTVFLRHTPPPGCWLPSLLCALAWRPIPAPTGKQPCCVRSTHRSHIMSFIRKEAKVAKEPAATDVVCMCSPCDLVRDPKTNALGYRIKAKNYKDHHFVRHEQPFRQEVNGRANVLVEPSCTVRNCTYLQQKTHSNLSVSVVLLKEMLEDKKHIQELHLEVCGVINFFLTSYTITRFFSCTTRCMLPAAVSVV